MAWIHKQLNMNLFNNSKSKRDLEMSSKNKKMDKWLVPRILSANLNNLKTVIKALMAHLLINKNSQIHSNKVGYSQAP